VIGERCGSECTDMPAQPGMQSRIAPLGEPGEPLVIVGTVRHPDGTPAAGIVVYAYQTNQAGIYPPDARPPGSFRGWAKTNATGQYRFETIRPGPYPDDDIPAPVHLHIIEPNRVTYTIDDIIFRDDPLWPGRWSQDMRNGRGGDSLSDPSRDAAGVWHIENDITLGENIAGYDAAWAD
jgi:protocatechuate 3,4-dioxygenase beta subunit